MTSPLSIASGESLSPAKRTSQPVRKRGRITPIFSVKVTKSGNIFTSKEGKPWKHLDNTWWLRKHPYWFWAAKKFTKKYGLVPSQANVLASILMPKPDPNDHHSARKTVYRKLAKWAGFNEREPLPDYIVQAVRWVYPEKDDKDYMGSKDC
jgi:hypothetical protein